MGRSQSLCLLCSVENCVIINRRKVGKSKLEESGEDVKSVLGGPEGAAQQGSAVGLHGRTMILQMHRTIL